MVRRKNIIKRALREISLNSKSFFSLLLIVIIAQGLFIGLKSTPSSMMETMKTHHKKTNLFDLKINSSVGLTNVDMNLIKQINGVKGVSLSKQMDAITTIDNKDYLINIESINKDRSLKSNDYINRLTLTAGRYPSTLNEGLVEERMLLDNNLSIGDLITLNVEDKNSLRAKKIKIVGTVISSYHASDNLESYYIYLEENNFNINYYTDCFVTLEEASKHDPYGKKYDDYVSDYAVKIKEKIIDNANFTYENNVALLKNDIESLKDELNKLNQNDLPINSLNELVKDKSEELKQKENTLSKTSKLNLTVEKRNDTPSFYNYNLETKKVENIANVFCPLLLLVSALVVLNYVIKMIIQDKEEIKMLKLIGYGKISTSFKYMFYGTLTCILGSVIGTVLFYKIIPVLIGFCYNKTYNIPIMITRFQFKYFIEATTLAFSITFILIIISFLLICEKHNKNLAKEKKSSKLNLNKVLLNNVFNDKKRLLMMVIITCLFSALILSSFGIKDSFVGVINKQYQKINKFDLSININEAVTEDDKVVLGNNILKNKEVKELTLISKINVIVKNKNNDNDATLIIPNNVSKINNFISFGKEENKSLENGVIITKKLSKILNVKKNDELNIYISENKNTNVKVSGITENYIDHYVYMSPTFYKKIIKENPKFLTILINTTKKDDGSLKNKINDFKNVTDVTLTKETKHKYNKINYGIKNTTLLLIILTFLYAPLVLSNILKNNIAERKKELYTLRTLGLSNTEIIRYIFKEISLLSIIGYFTGIIIGNIITYIIIKTCETNTIMISLTINVISYLITFVLIMVLTGISLTLTKLTFKKD